MEQKEYNINKLSYAEIREQIKECEYQMDCAFKHNDSLVYAIYADKLTKLETILYK